MILFLKRNKHFLFLVLIFIIAEIIVNPLGEFPIVDDWCYTQILNEFNRTGKMLLGDFPAMTLYTQVIWGSLFIKTFGFSLVVLRFSSLVSAIIGFAFLNKLALQISGNRMVAFVSCLVLMFNPMIFSLSNSFMTDVNFNTLVIICCYFMYNFFRTRRYSDYVLFVVFSTALVLLRQYGVIFPACFIVACFFVKEKKALHFILAGVAFAIVFGTFKIYESYLATASGSAATYKFSGSIDLLATTFWHNLFTSFKLRYREVILHLLVYPMPLAVIFLSSLLREFKIIAIVIVVAIAALLSYCLMTSIGNSSETVFSNMMLGTESFYESFRGARHNSYQSFDTLLYVIRWISSFLTLLVLLLGLTHIIQKKKWKMLLQPEIVFIVVLVFAYTFMILITGSYFDRYHIPLISMMILLTAYFGKTYSPSFKFAIVPLLFWMYISIAGTKDYMELNRQKWNAYGYLRKNLNVPLEQINGGFEINCWEDGHGWGWRDFISLDRFTYLIQFNPEENFKPLKEYEFQRYFPYKKDKIYIFVRHDEKNSKHDQ